MPVVLVNRAMTTGAAPQDAVAGGRVVPRSHTCTTRNGSREGSTVPVARGSGTSGGRKKKWGLPPWAPSLMSAAGRAGSCAGSVGNGWSAQPSAARPRNKRPGWRYLVAATGVPSESKMGSVGD